MKKLYIIPTVIIFIFFLSCKKEPSVAPGNAYNTLQSTNVPSTFSMLCGGNSFDANCCKEWSENNEDWSFKFFNNGTVLEKHNGKSAIAYWRLDETESYILFEYIQNPDTWSNKRLHITQIAEHTLMLQDETDSYNFNFKHVITQE